MVKDNTHLVIEKFLVVNNPQTSQFFQAGKCLERGQVVYKYVWDPQVPHEVEIDRQPYGLIGFCTTRPMGCIDTTTFGQFQSAFSPNDPEVHVELNRKLFIIHS